MKKKLLFTFLIVLSTQLFSLESYTTYEAKDKYGYNVTYVKVNGFEKPLELLVGVGTPKVLNMTSLSPHIKLLNCFGGDLGTSTMVGYFYTYILNTKTKKVIGLFEYYDDYGAYSLVDKQAVWKLKKDIVEVVQYNMDEDKYITKVFKVD